jgi:hypothetical protein
MRFPPLLSQSHFWKIAGTNLVVGNLILWIFCAWFGSAGSAFNVLLCLAFSVSSVLVLRFALPFCSGSSESINTFIGFVASYAVYMLAFPVLVFVVSLFRAGEILVDPLSWFAMLLTALLGSLFSFVLIFPLLCTLPMAILNGILFAQYGKLKAQDLDGATEEKVAQKEKRIINKLKPVLVLLAMSLMVAFIYGLNESKPGDFDKPAYTDEERYEQAYQRALRRF